MQKILFIVNPISGHHNKEKFPDIVESTIDKTKYDYTIVFTERAKHATEIAREAVGKYDVVAAVGGDGTINEVAQALINTNTVFAIVPFGSGNGLARHLHLPLNAKKNISSVINNGKPVAMDTCLLNDLTFLSLAGTGFDATVADGFAKCPERGFKTYLKTVVKDYFKFKAETVSLQIDDQEPLIVHPLMITFANSNQFGYNAKISPKASLTDGKVDVVIFNKPSLISIPILATRLMTGRLHKALKTVKILRGAKIKVVREHDAPVNLDGEPIQMNKDFTISVNPKSLKVLTLTPNI